jgi:hypothetical protein
VNRVVPSSSRVKMRNVGFRAVKNGDRICGWRLLKPREFTVR